MKERILKHIKETPRVVIENTKGSQNLTKLLVDEFTAEHNYEDIWIIASGSAYNSALIASDYIRETLEVEVKIMTPTNFVNYADHIVPENFIFVVSQSGDGDNEILALEKLKQLKRKAIAVVGNNDGKLKDHADLLVHYGARIETPEYASESVTILATFLMLFGLETAFKLFIVNEEDMFVDKNTLKEVMYNYTKTSESVIDFIEANMEALSDMKVLYLVALGSNLGTAFEGALKISQKVYIPTIAVETEEYIHGPHLQLSPDYSVLMFDNGDQTQERTLQIYEATKHVTEKAFLVSPNYKSDDKRVVNVYNPDNHLFNPLATLPVVQLIASYINEEIKPKSHPKLDKFVDFIDKTLKNT